MKASARNIYPVTSHKAAAGLKSPGKHANQKAFIFHALTPCRMPPSSTEIAGGFGLDRYILARRPPSFEIGGGGEKGKQGPMPNSVQGLRRMTDKELGPVSGNDKPQQPFVIIYTGGACSGNPGPAGIGVVLEYRGKTWEISEYIGDATNEIAELEAVRKALLTLNKKDIPVRLYTDSGYVHGLLTKGWSARKNTELVKSVRDLLKEFARIEIIKVSGHSGFRGNELADQLATAAIRNNGSK